MNVVGLVAERELRDAFRSRAYWVIMAILFIGSLAVVVVPRLVTQDETHDVGVAGDAPSTVVERLEGLAEAFDVGLEVEQLHGRGDAIEAVRTERLEAALVFGPDGPVLVRRVGTSETLVAIAGQAAAAAMSQQRLVDAGLDAAVAREALDAPPPAELTVDGDRPARTNIAYGVSFMLYVMLLFGGMGVATGVAVEKSTRIAEVLVTTVRPTHLLAGKVLGIGLSTFLLLLIGLIPFLAAMGAGELSVPAGAVGDVVAGFGWFVLGFAMYAIGFGVLGALVDRQEDLGSAVAPFSILLVLSLGVAMHGRNAPDSLPVVVGSLFPLSAPIVMPVRLAGGGASAVEVVLAIVLCLLTIALLVRVGGAAYHRALLRGGRRLRLAEVLRA
ncbi:MAG TPA: ABC transporter permease [Acidimicrobiales bacterium]|nr:ABC transporter permease [Acidimicrobiales bacterium]